MYEEYQEKMESPEKILKNNQGQAITEYLLLLILVVGFVVLMNTVLKKTMAQYWINIAQKIVQACPGCRTVESLRIPGYN